MEEKDFRGTLVLKDRKSVTLDGVKNVIGFDESYVSLESESGKVTIEGGGLKIESLSKEDGVIFVSGTISGIFYSEEKSAKSVFAKLFG